MLNGYRILIIGGSSGIGLAVARHALKAGAHVIIASRHAQEKIGSLPEHPKEIVQTYAFDITLEKEHRKLFEKIGKIDHLVVTVRPDLKSSPFLALDVNQAKLAFDTKFWGQYQLIQAAYEFINVGGSITLTSGIAGEKVYKGASTMCAINSATETLCRVLAVELAPIRINVVSPGFVAPKPPEIQEYASHFPLKRLASVDEVAQAYIYLMSNTYVTGTSMIVDGGARLV